MTRLTCAAVAMLFAITVSAHADVASPNQSVTTLATRLLYPDGKPAVDATAIIDLIDVKTRKLTVYTAKPDLLGNVTVALPSTQFIHSFQILYATSPTGIGFWTEGNSDETMPTVVQPFTSIRIHLVDSAGKPIPNTKIGPKRLETDYSSSGWHDSIPGPWNRTTDSNGNATLTGLPQGYDLTLDVSDDRYALPDTRFPIQLANSAVTRDTTIQLSPAGSISGRVLFGDTGKPVVGIDVYVSEPDYNHRIPGILTDSTGAFTVKRLPAGAYNLLPLDWSEDAFPDWVGESQNVNVTPGNNFRIILNLVHGGTVAGKVTDRATGKPISNIEVSASQHQDSPAQSRQITTDAYGTYSFHMLPGRVDITASIPGTPGDGLQAKHILVTDNETTKADFQFDASAFPIKVNGLVLGPDGKPIAGAEVSTTEAYPGKSTVRTDSLGRFTLDSPGLLPKQMIFARSGDLCSATPTIFGGESQLTIQLTAGNMCTLTGKVEDQSGTPVPNAPVLLFASSKTWIPNKFTETDAKGMYTFQHVYGNAEYGSESNPPGYWFASCGPIDAVPAQTTQLPPLIVQAPNSHIGGCVVDATGNPAADVPVYCQDHQYSRTYTDQSGHFTINRVPSGKISLRIIIRDNHTYITQQADSGRTDIIIRLPAPEILK